MAVLEPPVVFKRSALSPMAALEEPVLLKRANAPLAVLPPAVVLLKSAPPPVAVFSSAVLPRSVPALKRAGAIAQERIQTNASVICARGKTQEGVLSLCGVASGIASVRRWNNCLGFRRKPKADEHE